LQNHATNGTSVSGMFDTAKKYPLRVFNQLSSLSKHHINKLGDTRSAIYYKKLLDSFLGEMDIIPTKLSLEEQGDFILGYHYQNNKFYTKKDKGDIENE
jgi:CRISPR-associated protein Csd1